MSYAVSQLTAELRAVIDEQGIYSAKGREIQEILDDPLKFQAFVENLEAGGVEINWDIDAVGTVESQLHEIRIPTAKPMDESSESDESDESDEEAPEISVPPKPHKAHRPKESKDAKDFKKKYPKMPKFSARPITADGRIRLKMKPNPMEPRSEPPPRLTVTAKAADEFNAAMTTPEVRGRLARPSTAPKDLARRARRGVATSSVLIPPSAPTRPKKSDPVAMYASFRRGWDRDATNRKKNAAKTTASRAPEQRRRTTPKPNTYVVPTDKKRDGLRWEVRRKTMSLL
ncbi:Protein of unknown function DUF1042 [Carpediemonas membranifera]|uniref:Centriolar and ciliogenesis-associated protein HYLS1 C-terminal domain-containing protein n=1 Tax=Carpediemonas membranifera TaxID=201153 RepID=A0A8J6E2X5_9EUKA|nr:Protein of unknown function DUF1042 [Carpediemonas membranifera]|eukprot:KAG9394871.1 Protein of unknown function DUF1042 [Carpediemonas membranifera]